MESTNNTIEATGAKFDLKTYFAARDLCLQVVDEIIARVEPGISEADGQELIKTCFARHGITKFWHPSKFRIGADTTKTFRAPPDATLLTEAGEMCFVDVGPIIDEHEADFGRTFIVGGGVGAAGYERLIASCEQVFRDTAAVWKADGLTGLALFNYAQARARELGYELNPLMAGHRLGDFPHHVHSRQGLFEFNQVPSKNLWVLEIHLRDLGLDRGAFFEDVLF
jgi:Xaa-Pro aminopeptidase